MNKRFSQFQIYIPESFEETWKNFERLAKLDESIQQDIKYKNKAVSAAIRKIVKIYVDIESKKHLTTNTNEPNKTSNQEENSSSN